MTERKFHPPTNDIIFHCLFGTKGQERITKDFLESLLKKEIEDIDLDANLEFILRRVSKNRRYRKISYNMEF